MKDQIKLEIAQGLQYSTHKSRVSTDAKPAHIAINAVSYMSCIRDEYLNHPDLKWQRTVRALPPYDQNSAWKWWPLAEEEIRRSFPTLENHLLGAHSKPRKLWEAIRRVKTPFLNSTWKVFECFAVP